ncbi:hypothetical protein HDV01_002928 [Terramyces sp. JEL0728]|nr:hypothetical protein HDV01_002928 [Terramyces sp. JEL0728]
MQEKDIWQDHSLGAFFLSSKYTDAVLQVNFPGKKVFGLANTLQIRDLEQTCMEWIVKDLSNQEIKDINEWFNLLLLAVKYNINLEFIDNMITAASCESIEIQELKKSMESTNPSFGRYLFISKLLQDNDIPQEVLNHFLSNISISDWSEAELHHAMKENIIPKNDMLIALGKINIDEEDKNATIKASSKWMLFNKEVDRTGSAETLPDTWFATQEKQPTLYQPEPKRLPRTNTILDSFEIDQEKPPNEPDMKTVDNDRSLQELYNKLERLATISPTNSFHEGKSYSDFSEHTSDYLSINRYGSVKRYNDDSTILSESCEQVKPFNLRVIAEEDRILPEPFLNQHSVQNYPNVNPQSLKSRETSIASNSNRNMNPDFNTNLAFSGFNSNPNFCPRYDSIPRQYYHDPQSTPKPHVKYYTEPRSFPTKPLPVVPNNIRLPPKRKHCVDLEKQEVKCFKKKGFTDIFKGLF